MFVNHTKMHISACLCISNQNYSTKKGFLMLRHSGTYVGVSDWLTLKRMFVLGSYIMVKTYSSVTQNGKGGRQLQVKVKVGISHTCVWLNHVYLLLFKAHCIATSKLFVCARKQHSANKIVEIPVGNQFWLLTLWQNGEGHRRQGRCNQPLVFRYHYKYYAPF